MHRIPMPNPIAELDGDEMTRILWRMIKDTLIVPFVLRYAYGVELPLPIMMLTVGIGELISCGVLGLLLYYALRSHRNVIFRNQMI